jgi:hypothetical protein
MPLGVRPPIRTFCALVLALNACAADGPTAVDEVNTAPSSDRPVVQPGHSPPFATMPYGRFSRVDAVAIAEQEWRLFGQRVYDDPPRTDS